MVRVYKICGAAEWAAAERTGRYSGSCDDRRDGFIHLSTAEQLAGTVEKHFRGCTDLVLVALDAARLGPALKWEASRGGAQFPHLYSFLDPSAALWVRPLETGADGIPRLPAELTP